MASFEVVRRWVNKNRSRSLFHTNSFWHFDLLIWPYFLRLLPSKKESWYSHLNSTGFTNFSCVSLVIFGGTIFCQTARVQNLQCVDEGFVDVRRWRNEDLKGVGNNALFDERFFEKLCVLFIFFLFTLSIFLF